MVGVAKLTRALQATDEETGKLVREFDARLDEGSQGLLRWGHPNVYLGIESEYAFECQVCREIMPENSFYRLTKKVVGGAYARETNPEDIKTSTGIVRLADLDEEPEFSSTLNFVKGVGYVCDHCKDSIFPER